MYIAKKKKTLTLPPSFDSSATNISFPTPSPPPTPTFFFSLRVPHSLTLTSLLLFLFFFQFVSHTPWLPLFFFYFVLLSFLLCTSCPTLTLLFFSLFSLIFSWQHPLLSQNSKPSLSPSLSLSLLAADTV